MTQTEQPKRSFFSRRVLWGATVGSALVFFIAGILFWGGFNTAMWILADRVISSVIIGANSVNQLNDTITGDDIRLSSEDKAALDQITDWEK